MRLTPARRRGAALLEGAIVYPIVVLLILALVVGGLGVFRTQQIACQAREAARYASVRGADYASDTGNSSPTQQDVIDQTVTPLAAGMDTGQLTVHIEWIDGTNGKATDWDSSSKAITGTTDSGATVNNRVRVTVSYQWFPEALLVGPFTMQSVHEVALSY
jgi:Flp pilus assembly protein TadG